MALAEAGRFDEAVSRQRRAALAATQAGLSGRLEEIERSLTRYQSGQPVRLGG